VLGHRPGEAERERRVALVLFGLTCVSVFAVHLLGWQPQRTLSAVAGSACFAAALMGILVAHELGHWWTARVMGFRLSLPWFLPAPILVGTLGAIIRIEERPPTREALLRMGAAGPLAGLAAVVAVLVVRGLLPDAGAPSEWELRRPLLWWLVGLPLGSTDAPTPSDPLGFAAWIGCLVTSMNLLPFGQLDGGHVLGAMRPTLRHPMTLAVTGALLLAGLAWPPWALWAGVLWLLGARVPVVPRDDVTPPTPEARVTAAAAVVSFLLCATPVPTSW
jgi:membrane-associated protease RseP (regulator of RpoE activity)